MGGHKVNGRSGVSKMSPSRDSSPPTSTREPGRVSRIVCCRNGVRRKQGRDSRIEHVGDGNRTSDSAREPQTQWHTCSGGSDRFQIQGQPGMLTTVLSEKEKHTEECQDKAEGSTEWREMERARTPPQALGCSSCWSRVEGIGRETGS